MVMSCVFLLWYDDVLCVTGMMMSCVFLLCVTVDPRLSEPRLSNYQINDIHSICGVHQIELTSPIEIILLHLSEYSVIRLA